MAYGIVPKDYSGPVTNEICNAYFDLCLSPQHSKFILPGYTPAGERVQERKPSDSSTGVTANRKPWHELQKSQRYERLHAATSVLVAAFQQIALILNMDGVEEGVVAGVQNAVRYVFEH